MDLHLLGEWGSSRTIAVPCEIDEAPRVGIVGTVYRAQDVLDIWCARHLAAGFGHLVVIFDHMEEAGEAACAARMREKYPADRLTVWSGTEVESRRWPGISGDPRVGGLVRLALTGSSAEAVSARQALNATAALHAARDSELGGLPLDWLLHLDADELFYLEGSERGGASLSEHFSAAAAAGLELIRYVNHELLLPTRAEHQYRFKLNPWLAAARDGVRQWNDFERRLGRRYFNAYVNGKSAVAVSAGEAAAGVHSWFLRASETLDNDVFVAGPTVLHFHCATSAAFRQKFLAIADLPPRSGRLLFDPLPVEVAALDLIMSLRSDGASPERVRLELDRLYKSLMQFSDEEIVVLLESGLVVSPDLARVS